MQVMQCDLKCKLCSVNLNARLGSVILNASYAVWSEMQDLCIVILNASYAVWS